MTVRFTIVQHSHDNWPRSFEMDWADLAVRLGRHDVGEKDGAALICATFTGPPRGASTLAERWLVALDVELNKQTGEVPPGPELIAQYLRHKGLAAVLWTTFGHQGPLPRYRVVMPLDGPLRPLAVGRTVDRMIPQLVASNLQLNGRIDTGKCGAESLFYLARHPAGGEHWSCVVEGKPLKADELLAVARMVSIGVQMKKAQLDALRRTQEFPAELRQWIEAFNDAHELPELFAQYGYRRMGDRWKSQYQSPHSTAATAIFPDHTGWYSWSESDVGSGLGHPSGDGGVFGDGFSLYVHYEHGNNFRAAIAALRERHEAKEG